MPPSFAAAANVIAALLSFHHSLNASNSEERSENREAHALAMGNGLDPFVRLGREGARASRKQSNDMAMAHLLRDGTSNRRRSRLRPRWIEPGYAVVFAGVFRDGFTFAITFDWLIQQARSSE